MGGFCLVVEFHHRGSATNEATPSSVFSYITHFLTYGCTYMERSFQYVSRNCYDYGYAAVSVSPRCDNYIPTPTPLSKPSEYCHDPSLPRDFHYLLPSYQTQGLRKSQYILQYLYWMAVQIILTSSTNKRSIILDPSLYSIFGCYNCRAPVWTHVVMKLHHWIHSIPINTRASIITGFLEISEVTGHKMCHGVTN